MKIFTSYDVKIKRYRRIFDETVDIYRSAVDFFIDVALAEWDSLAGFSQSKQRLNAIERLTIKTTKRPEVKYDFGKEFYKFPSYLRRSAIMDAVGKTSSYISNLKRWIDGGKHGRHPSKPRAGRAFPALYKESSYVRLDDYSAKIKVFTRNTWDWLQVFLKKQDADYIFRNCAGRKECVPTLKKKERNGSLISPSKKMH